MILQLMDYIVYDIFVTYTFAKGLKEMPRGLKVSHVLIANIIPFVNKSNFLI